MGLLEGLGDEDVGVALEGRVVALGRVDDVGQALAGHVEERRLAERGVDVARGKGGAHRRRVHVDDLEVALREPVGRQHLVDGEVMVGAAEDRELVALEVLHAPDLGALGDGQIGCLVRPAGEQQLGLQAVGAADHRGQVALEREIELAVGDGLVHGGPGALEERPLDLHARIVRELLLQVALGMCRGGRAAADEEAVADADRGVADADHERVGGVNGRRQCHCCQGECHQAHRAAAGANDRLHRSDLSERLLV